MKRMTSSLLACVAITCLYIGDAIGQWRSRPPVISVPVSVTQPEIHLQVFHPDTKAKAAYLPEAVPNGRKVVLR